MKFSIIVVCLNPGTKLNQTLDSILAQTCPDFEVIVKDGGSRDGSIESMRTDGRIHLYQEPDHSIYEAMNQAVSHVTGDYILFLNCGDLFYDKEVLAHTAQFMEQHPMKLQGIYYGDTYSAKTDTKISSPHHRLCLLPQHSLPSVLLLCRRPVPTEALRTKIQDPRRL